MPVKHISLNNAPINYSNHALQRMAQRNLSHEQTSFILRFGRYYHRAGAVLVHLRRKDIPSDLRANDIFARLEGTTVVLSRENWSVVTVWRNRGKGLQHIRGKPRFDCSRSTHACYYDV